MKKTILATFFLTALVSGQPLWAKVSGLPDFTELAKQNSSAVVNISSTPKKTTASRERNLPPGYEDHPLNEFFGRFFGQEPEGRGLPDPRSSLGSGFIISADGYVITNNHVVRNADEVVVRLSDRREFTAEIVGTDERSDLAVLKVESDQPLPAVKLGNSAELEVGEWVLAIGSPFGFDHSVTAGIVSAKGRSLPNENYTPFIQTDVAINPGNSGGPLFNLEGEVIGVNSQIYSRTGGFMGLSFAIPVDVVMNVYEQLRDSGSVTRGWLGVLIQDVTQDLAESFGMSQPQGALVSKVLEDSPAEKAGFDTGDIVMKFNGIDIRQSSDLPPVVGSTSVGDKIPVTLLRDGAKQEILVEIGELPRSEEIAGNLGGGSKMPTTEDKQLALSVVELNTEERERHQVSGGGVLIDDIEDGPAYSAGLRKGDVILQLNNQKISSVEDYKKIAGNLTAGKSVPILIQRQGGPLFLAMKLPKGTS
ncbi:MAG: DegQ family serine endoprotease [Pseudomonadota bacterium]